MKENEMLILMIPKTYVLETSTLQSLICSVHHDIFVYKLSLTVCKL